MKIKYLGLLPFIITVVLAIIEIISQRGSINVLWVASAAYLFVVTIYLVVFGILWTLFGD